MRLPFCTRALPLWAALLAAGLAGGCARMSTVMSDGVTSLVKPYKVEIVQGNVVTREQAERVKPGMSRAQVREILGSPLLADPFHAQRWDYVFTMRRGGNEILKRAVSVSFNADVVEAIVAPELPSEYDFVASISRPRRDTPEPKLALTAEERAALPPPAQPGADASRTPLGAARTYPPLEPQ